MEIYMSANMFSVDVHRASTKMKGMKEKKRQLDNSDEKQYYPKIVLGWKRLLSVMLNDYYGRHCFMWMDDRKTLDSNPMADRVTSQSYQWTSGPLYI